MAMQPSLFSREALAIELGRDRRTRKLIADLVGGMISNHGPRSHSARNTRSVLDCVVRRRIRAGSEGAAAAACLAHGSGQRR
jgi:hypothetical protein